MSNICEVYCEDKLIGHISDNDGFSFSYIQGAKQISSSLPITEHIDPEIAMHFFVNLLPEGKRKEFFAKNIHTSSNDTFSLLRHYGQECAGSITIKPESPTTSMSMDIDITEELSERIQERETLDLCAGYKMSLAGIESKTSVVVKDTIMGKRFLKPANGISTHIVKGSRSLAANETFCTTLAKNSGLSTPDVELLSFNGTEGFVSKRYDRLYDNDEVKSLHQEDFCQFLGRSNDDKYCSNHKGITNSVIINEILPSLPEEDTKAFIKAMIFSLCIGNCDDHAKNYAVLYKDNSVSLAPIYDLCSVTGAKKLTLEWKSVETTLSRPFANTFDFYKINPKHIASVAKEFSLDTETFCDIIKEVTSNIKDALPHTSMSMLNTAEHGGFDDSSRRRIKETALFLEKHIEERTQRFEDIAEKTLHNCLKSNVEHTLMINM